MLLLSHATFALVGVLDTLQLVGWRGLPKPIDDPGYNFHASFFTCTISFHKRAYLVLGPLLNSPERNLDALAPGPERALLRWMPESRPEFVAGLRGVVPVLHVRNGELHFFAGWSDVNGG